MSARPGFPQAQPGFPEGRAIVYCEGAFHTSNGKTAHGLVRRTRRYTVLSVVDSQAAGNDAGELLDGASTGVPICPDLESAAAGASATGNPATHMVIGLAPDGGRLDRRAMDDVRRAVRMGLHVDSGLHDFLSEDPEIARLSREAGIVVRDIRKPPPRETLHFFSGKIRQVEAFRVAVLGTDSALGKRTTAWMLVDALAAAGCASEMIGTGQTAWLQGARYCLILDSLVNDFVSGEIEHLVWTAWRETGAEALVIEGQGSLMNPAYPGGFEILAAARPHAVVLQHAPARKDYDGFPGHPLHPLTRQIEAVELIGGTPVVAVTVNHEGLPHDRVSDACREIGRGTGLPVCDPLLDGVGPVMDAVLPRLEAMRSARASES